MSAVAKLEALLARVQTNRALPRPAASAPAPAPALVAAPHAPAPLMRDSDPALEAVTPPRGLRTPAPPSPAVPVRAAVVAPPPAPPERTRPPTPLEIAVVGETEHAQQSTPLAAREIVPAESQPPSMPIVQLVSEPAVIERVTFGVLLRRTLALRPR